MNIQKAKEILSSTHSSDIEDPVFMEALALAETHPELKEWIEEQNRLDPLIADALSDVPVPEGMEQQLLNTVNSIHPGKIYGLRRAVWGFGIAALLFFGIGVVFLSKGESLVQGIQTRITGKNYSDMSDFREGMAYFVSDVYFRLDHMTENLDSIENWLDENQVPGFDSLPESLLALNPIGCKELSWQDEKVSLVCFHSKEGKIVHMFILNRAGAYSETYEGITTVAVSHGLETGGWLTDEKVYLLVGSDSDVDIEFALI